MALLQRPVLRRRGRVADLQLRRAASRVSASSRTAGSTSPSRLAGIGAVPNFFGALSGPAEPPIGAQPRWSKSSSPAAPGSSARTSFATPCDAHPDWRVTTLDKLTYAGRLREPARRHRRSAAPLRAGRRRRRRCRRAARPGRRTSSSISPPRRTSTGRSCSAGEFITTDVFGTFVLLEAAREAHAPAPVRPDLDRRGLRQRAEGSSRETDELKPRNPYSASKAGADRLAYSYWATYGVPVIITRASNNYGPYQFPEKVIPLFVTNAIDDIQVPLYGDGLNERDWLHVDDHCRAIDLLIDAGRATARSTTSAAATTCKNVDLTHRILAARREARIADPPRPRPARPRPPLLARHRRSCRRLGWAPQIAVRSRARRNRGVVPAERVVVAADQGRRPRVPRLLRHAVRQHAGRERQRDRSSARDRAPPGLPGSHLVERLLQSHDAVARLVATRAASGRGRPRSGVHWQPVDITDRDAVERALDASSAHRSSFIAPGFRTSPNRGRSAATRAARERLRHARICSTPCATSRPTCSWSSCRFGARLPPAAEALREEDPLGPVDPYGVSKLAQEMVAAAARDARSWSRVRSTTPDRGSPRSFVTSSFARQIAEIEAGRREPVLHVGNLDARRDITDVRDTVRAYEALASGGRTGHGRTTSAPASRIGSAICSSMLLGDGARAGHGAAGSRTACGRATIRSSLGDPSRIAAETGWRAEIPIERTLAGPAGLVARPESPRMSAQHSACRKTRGRLVHIAFGACALLLPLAHLVRGDDAGGARGRVQHVRAAPRSAAPGCSAPDERGRYRLKSGIVLYPRSVLGLLLLLPAAAWTSSPARGACWRRATARRRSSAAVCRFGRSRGTQTSRWAARWRSSLFGSAAAAALLWWCRDTVIPPSYWWYPLVGRRRSARYVAAAVETIPISFDDNVSVAAIGGGGHVGALARQRGSSASPRSHDGRCGSAARRSRSNAVVAAAGYFARTVSLSGAIVGALLGTIVFVSHRLAGLDAAAGDVRGGDDHVAARMAPQSGARHRGGTRRTARRGERGRQYRHRGRRRGDERVFVRARAGARRVRGGARRRRQRHRRE